MPDVDLAIVKLALVQLSHASEPLAVNISAAALCNANFREQLIALLRSEPERTKHLWLEFPEICMLRHLEELRAF